MSDVLPCAVCGEVPETRVWYKHDVVTVHAICCDHAIGEQEVDEWNEHQREIALGRAAIAMGARTTGELRRLLTLGKSVVTGAVTVGGEARDE